MGRNVNSKLFGLISGAWQKQPIILGYSARYAEQNTGALNGSGNGGVALSVVPAGEIWVVTHIATRNESAASATSECIVNDGTSDYSLSYVAALAQWLYNYYIGYLVLKAGDKVSSWHTGGGAASTVRTIAWGHKIDIDQ